MILSGRVGIWGQEWVQPKHAGRLLSWCPCTDWTHPIQGSRGERQASKAEASMVRTWGMDLKRNKAVVGEFDDLGNGGGNLARLDELCGADIVNHALAPGRPQGLEGTRQFLPARTGTCCTRPDGWNRGLLPRATWSFSLAGGSTAGPEVRFRGFDASAETYRRDVAFTYRLAAGKIAERWATRDDLAMLLQLGALKPQAE